MRTLDLSLTTHACREGGAPNVQEYERRPQPTELESTGPPPLLHRHDSERCFVITSGAWGQRGATGPAEHADVTPINHLPNPYETVRDWGTLPDERVWGSVSAVHVDIDGQAHLGRRSLRHELVCWLRRRSDRQARPGRQRGAELRRGG